MARRQSQQAHWLCNSNLIQYARQDVCKGNTTNGVQDHFQHPQETLKQQGRHMAPSAWCRSMCQGPSCNTCAAHLLVLSLMNICASRDWGHHWLNFSSNLLHLNLSIVCSLCHLNILLLTHLQPSCTFVLDTHANLTRVNIQCNVQLLQTWVLEFCQGILGS